MRYVISVLLLIFIRPAQAVIGDIDFKNEFPYVVNINLGDGRCSGAVTVDNLVTTAAHCVWDDERQTLTNPNNIQISYVDLDGATRTTGVMKIFISEEYRTTAPWKTIASYQLDQKVSKDIAILIPKESIELYEYSNWITDALGREIWSSNLHSLDLLRPALGPISSVTTRVVGYGGFDCDKEIIDTNNRDNCKRDGKRRYAEAPLLSSASWGGSVPNVWCSGIGAAGSTPIRRGDSGGPQFVKSLDGRWLYVGNTSSSYGNDTGCASSLIANIQLWKDVLASPEYKNRLRHSDYWFAKRATHAIEDFFRLLSLPAQQALPRLLQMYYGVEKDPDGNLVNVGGLDYRGETNITNYSYKKKLIEKWPVRQFKVDSASADIAPIFERRRARGSYHAVEGSVSWSLSNPATGEKREGRTQFVFTVITVDLDTNPMQVGTSRNPTLVWEEDFTPTLGQIRDFELFQNFSYDGGDYRNWKDMDLDGCQRACKVNDQCVAFSYIERLRWCWLKSKVPSATAKPGITSGLKQTDDMLLVPMPNQPNSKFRILHNFSYDGADYKNVKGIDFDSCQRMCSDEGRCETFSYIERSRWCWLKSSEPTSSVKPGITSGRKEN